MNILMVLLIGILIVVNIFLIILTKKCIDLINEEIKIIKDNNHSTKILNE